jgi:signal transduction histidine kinase
MQHQWRLQPSEGAVLQVDAMLTPVRLQGRDAALLVARDVTERRALEREREALQSQLFHAQRMEAVGELAGGIAHDFNNLLHAIQGSLEMLDRAFENRERARQLIGNIGVATERASTLTRQLLGFAREGKYQVEEIDVAELVRQTADLFEPLLDQDVAFKLVVHPDPMTVSGDFTQLQQVLLNMLLNAREAIVDANRPGRVVMRAEPATAFTPGADTQADADRRPEIAIRIRDNGAGIPRDIREQVFEPFFTTKAAKGTGMGLAMAYGCIASHHGRIHVESETGQGSEFVIYLPRRS